jgi:Ca2+-dependent lipid-binding protein
MCEQAYQTNTHKLCQIYIRFVCSFRMAGRTSTVYKSLNPEWNEQVLMEFPVMDGDNHLRLAIIDEYRDHDDNKMGEVRDTNHSYSTIF